jgi:hypothetical protein
MVVQHMKMAVKQEAFICLLLTVSHSSLGLLMSELSFLQGVYHLPDIMFVEQL